MKKIRVLIVEDSRVVREFLESIIGNDPRLEVAASVSSGEEALKILSKASPDVISMDIRLPGMNGLEATQRIMSEMPMPIVVVSASVNSQELNISMNALRAGALSIVEKPVGTQHKDYEALAGRLCTQLVIMSHVKVIRQRMHRRLRFAESQGDPPSRRINRPPIGNRDFRCMGVVASTGGPSALVELFNSLPPDFPMPIFLVQHIADSFLDGFVSWLNSAIHLSVVIAGEGVAPEKGIIYVAPPDTHLALRSGRLHISRQAPVNSQRPSGNVLFSSLAADAGDRAIGVLLTGMGEDGAEGLLELRRAGGFTIAETESTAVVYGMPRAAVRLGAACESHPLPCIPGRICDLTYARKDVR